MELKTFKKLKDNRYEITTDEDKIILYDDLIIKYNLLFKKSIDDKLLKEILKENDKLKAYYRAIRSINVKMRNKKEIDKLLKKEGFSNDIITETIVKLYNDKYLDDERYIKAYIADSINLKNNGPLKIGEELIKIGFDESLVKENLSNIDNNIWLNKINKYITKKINTNHNLSVKALKDKIIIDLYKKGYAKEMIKSLLDEYEITNDLETVKKEYEKIKNKLAKKYSGTELDYYIKMKMYQKGYTSEDLDNLR